MAIIIIVIIMITIKKNIYIYIYIDIYISNIIYKSTCIGIQKPPHLTSLLSRNRVHLKASCSQSWSFG